MYVFGGRTLTHASPSSATRDHAYCGLFVYNTRTGAWRLLRPDMPESDNSAIPSGLIRSRIGHSMVYHTGEKKLFVFAGQRSKDYLCDFLVYDVTNDQLTEVSRDTSREGGPDPGFTQRATIDEARGEIYVLSGLMRDKSSTQEIVKTWLWVYSLHDGKWTKVYQNENVDQAYWEKMKDVEPVPRFAHQFVYDLKEKVHYLFGGNPGESGNRVRLNDFWELRLLRPSIELLYNRALFLIRKQRFLELCAAGESLSALRFLQNEISQCINHNEPTQAAEFHALTSELFIKRLLFGDLRALGVF